MSEFDGQIIRDGNYWYCVLNGKRRGAWSCKAYAEAGLEVERRRFENRRIRAAASEGRLAEALQIAARGHSAGGGA